MLQVQQQTTSQFNVHTVFQTNQKPQMYCSSWNQWLFYTDSNTLEYYTMHGGYCFLFGFHLFTIILPMTLTRLWCHGQPISCSLHLLKFTPLTWHLVSLNRCWYKCTDSTSCPQPIMWAITSYRYYLKVKLDYSSLLYRSVLGKKFPEVTNSCLSYILFHWDLKLYS